MPAIYFRSSGSMRSGVMERRAGHHVLLPSLCMVHGDSVNGGEVWLGSDQYGTLGDPLVCPHSAMPLPLVVALGASDHRRRDRGLAAGAAHQNP